MIDDSSLGRDPHGSSSLRHARAHGRVSGAVLGPRPGLQAVRRTHRRRVQVRRPALPGRRVVRADAPAAATATATAGHDMQQRRRLCLRSLRGSHLRRSLHDRRRLPRRIRVRRRDLHDHLLERHRLPRCIRVRRGRAMPLRRRDVLGGRALHRRQDVSRRPVRRALRRHSVPHRHDLRRRQPMRDPSRALVRRRLRLPRRARSVVRRGQVRQRALMIVSYERTDHGLSPTGRGAASAVSRPREARRFAYM
jgi:hypothetical protein